MFCRRNRIPSGNHNHNSLRVAAALTTLSTPTPALQYFQMRPSFNDFLGGCRTESSAPRTLESVPQVTSWFSRQPEQLGIKYQSQPGQWIGHKNLDMISK